MDALKKPHNYNYELNKMNLLPCHQNVANVLHAKCTSAMMSDLFLVEMSPKNSEFNATIQGINLNGTYRFAQFHMHWAPDSSHGSEHVINNQSFPMEVRIVWLMKASSSV